MPELRTRRQQPNPVTPQVPIPGEFPSIPDEVLERFPSAKDWERRLNDFWGRTSQALQEAQRQTAAQVNSTVIWTVDRFLIYTNEGQSVPMFALDDTGIRLGNVLVINTPGRKVYIGAGNLANDDTPFYIDTLGNFSLGASLVWDPDTDTLTITGIINATSGTIGGFDIGADYIRDAANSFGLASTVTVGNDIRFWAGDTFANRATAPLRIFENGSIIIGSSGSATNAIGLSITKDITAAAGSGYAVFCSSAITASNNGDGLYYSIGIPSFQKGSLTGLRAFGYYVLLNAASGAGTIDNAYGLYINTVSVATNNWGVYVLSAKSFFGGVTTFNAGLDATSIGATTPGTGAFTTLSATGTIQGSKEFLTIGAASVTTASSGRLEYAGANITRIVAVGSNATTFGEFDVLVQESDANSVTVLHTTSTGLAVTGVISTTDPAGGAGPNWKLGVAASVSPTSPNRTLRVDIAGTSYYIAAKTTND